MKRMIAFLLVTVLTVSIVLTGCGGSSNSTLSFSSYYKNARGFDEFKPLLQDFFALVQGAYKACNKEDPTTFSYDQTAFEELHLKITGVFSSSLDVKMSELSDPTFDRDAYDATSNAKDIYYNFNSFIFHINREIEAGSAPDDWHTAIGECLEQTLKAYSEDK